MRENRGSLVHSRVDTSRRTFLKAAGAAGAAAGVTGIAAAQNDEEPEQVFEFTGVEDAWIGQSPSSIEGTENPTLELEAGEKYRIRWTNGDGLSHNVAIYDENGNLLVHSPYTHKQGAVQNVDFIATEGMIDYYCEIHYLGMRGNIEVSGTSDQQEEPVDAGFFDEGPTIGLEKVADDLVYPVAIKTANEDRDRQFILDHVGQVYVHDDQNGLRDDPFLDLSDKVFLETNLHPEPGLMGMAFHPDFQNNGKLYVRYSVETADDLPEEYHHNELLSEFTANDDRSKVDPETEQILMTFPQPQSNHIGGDTAFGPDGYLYTATGDGGFGGDTGDMLGHATGGNGQDTTQNFLGGVLRIDVDNQEDGKPYAIPDDNPLVGELGLDEYYAWGFRSPWGMDIDSEGRLFLADVGRSLWEEVNIVENGGNYGWNIKEATNCFDPYHHTSPPVKCADEGYPPRNDDLIDPIIEYPHIYQENPVGQSVTGGVMYENNTVSPLENRYVFGDWSFSPVVPHGTLLVGSPPDGDGQLWNVQKLQVPGIARDDGRLPFFIIGFGHGADEEVYVATSRVAIPQPDQMQGAVYKIVPPGEGDERGVEAAVEGVEQEIDADELQREAEEANVSEKIAQVSQPGFGLVGALGGIASVVGYLFSRNRDGDGD